jgi:hypothetical protein
VLVWRGLPAFSGTPADYVIGQTGFENNLPNAGAPQRNAIGMIGPIAVFVAFKSLFVAELGRVLVWTPIPRRSGEPATAVLGRASLDDDDDGGAPDDQHMIAPAGLCSMDRHLYVTDRDRHRVLRFELAVSD